MDLQDKIKKLIELDWRNGEICRLRSEGWTLQRIAEKFGITRQRVWAILQTQRQPELE